MQTGAIISGWGHLIIIGLAALSGPIFDEPKDNEISISEVSVVSLSKFEVIQKQFDQNFDNDEILISEKNKVSITRDLLKTLEENKLHYKLN